MDSKALTPKQLRTARALLVAVPLILTLLAVETSFRVLDLRGYFAPRTRDWSHALVHKRVERVKGVDIQFKPHAEFRFDYDSNPRGYFDEQNGLTYRTNQHGFRGAEFPLAKPKGTSRIMVLGDSFTFGEGVKVEHLFTTRLQEILRARAEPNVDVLNFGVSAWSTRDEINYFENAGRSFEPDLVVVVFVLNDAGPDVLDLWNDFRASYEAPFPLKYSYAASYLYSKHLRKNAGRQYIDALVGSALTEQDRWNRSLAHLSRGRQLAESIGARFAVVIFPFMYELNDSYPFLSLHELVAARCRTEQIPCLDLLPAFKGQSYTDLWVHPADQHPNEKGHAIAADAIADFLIDDRLIEPDEAPHASAGSGAPVSRTNQ
jgi:lysophospholipase L1-like esterase